MRSLVPDSSYYEYLDDMRESSGVDLVLAVRALINEFPNLRSEEAKAICTDWRATYHQRKRRA